MKKTSLYAALLACSLTLAGAAFQTANAAIVMRAGHDSPETVPVAKGLAYWADLVNKRTNGEVQIQVFNNGTVGSASDYAVNCQLGTLDIGAVNQSVMTSFIPDIEAIDIPYLVTSYEQADKLFAGDGPLTKYYTDEINKIIHAPCDGSAIFRFLLGRRRRHEYNGVYRRFRKQCCNDRRDLRHSRNSYCHQRTS